MKRAHVIAAGVLALGIAATLPAAVLAPLAAQSTSMCVAAIETRTFAVENMTCALCPITVKTAMQGVDGVRSVEIDFHAKTATVVFDPAVATAEAIAAASTNAGYPAQPVAQGG